MSGRYLGDNCRVTLLCGILITALSNSIARGNESGDLIYSRIIVRSNDYSQLKIFAASLAIEIKPLVDYPNPSLEVQSLFKDYYVLESAGGTSLSSAEVLNQVRNLSEVGYAAADEVTTFEHESELPREMAALDGSNQLPYTPNDPMFPYQWDKTLTNTSMAWTVTKGNPEVTIAILDSGVDTSHADLRPNLAAGYNFIDRDANVEDVNGHGTRVAGTAAAKIDNNEGISGVAGNCSIMPVKIVSASGYITRSDVINAILYAADNGAKVINMSFGFDTPSEAEEKAVDYAFDKGLFLCSSAGNKGEYNPNHYPSSYEHVMSVGASTSGDSRVQLSDYGPNVNTYAPGQGVWQTLYDGGYGTGSGTSFASPQIAGLAALIYSVHPDYSSQDVWDAIVNGCDTITTDKGRVLRMNAAGALEAKSNANSDIVANEGENEPVRIETPRIQNGRIRFTYNVTTPASYLLSIYDVTGGMVYSRHGSAQAEGQIDIGCDMPAGTYFWRFETAAGTASGKVVWVK